MEKFVEFLNSTIGDSGMKMWILLVAIIAVIIIAGVVIGIVWAKKDKKKKAVKLQENAESEISGGEPAITAPPSMQQIDDTKEVVETKGAQAAESVMLDVAEEKASDDAESADDRLVSAKPPVSDNIETAADNNAAPESKPQVTADEPAIEKSADDEIKALDIVTAENTENKTADIKADNNGAKSNAVAIKADKASDAAPAAEAAADKAPAAKPIAKKVVAKKIAPTSTQKTAAAADESQSSAPKKAKVVGIDALPKKIKNTIKLEEVKTVSDTPSNGESFGKYIIFKDEKTNPNKPFKFALRANNGQLLFESEPYKVKPREASIQAFKKHVQIGDFIVDEDKFGFFRYKLYTDAGKLLGVGESYKTRSSCESSIESVKRFSVSATLIEDSTLEDDAE